MIDAPIYKKKLPQIWIEDDKFVIESSTFTYVISIENKQKRKNADPLKVLFRLCKRMDSESIQQTYAVN